MASARVTSPDGVGWTVRRRWLPRRGVRWRRLFSGRRGRPARSRSERTSWWDWIDIPWVDGFDSITVVVAVLVLTGLIVLAWFVLLPLLLVLLDLMAIVFLIVVGAIGRLLFRRPWEIEAASREERIGWRVAGWRRSGRVLAAVASQLEQGRRPAADLSALGIE